VLLNDFFGRTASAPIKLETPPPSCQMQDESIHSLPQHSQDYDVRELSITTGTESSNVNVCVNDEKRDDSPVAEKPKHDEQYETDLERALYLSGLEFQTSADEEDPGKYGAHKNLKKVETEEVDIETVSLIYREDFEEMVNNEQISLSFIQTYQGRVPGSSNGCTVIAPLLALHHLCNEQELAERSNILMKGKRNRYDPSVERKVNEQPLDSASNALGKETIIAVIDIQAPLVLPKVRGGLGLHGDALIIPSDVHDYLMNLNMLKQNQFVDVCTGNILDDLSLAKFIEAMGGSNDSKGGNTVEEKNLAATFYFHEHVISVLRKTRRTYTKIRETPSAKKTKKPSRRNLFKRRNSRLKRLELATNEMPDEETIFDEETYFEIIDSLPGAAMLGKYASSDGRKDFDHRTWIPATARIRCNCMRSLHAALRWYACSKFTSEDKKFIDTYQWDHMNVDFDPRVFQAFIWS